jgi:integrase
MNGAKRRWLVGQPALRSCEDPALGDLTVRPSDAPEAFLFGRGRVPLSSTELHRRWRRVLLAARVRYRETEQLRHTFASTMLTRNAPPLYVQGQGGWRSASVLLRVYARWIPQAFAEAAHEQPSATPAQPSRADAPALGA